MDEDNKLIIVFGLIMFLFFEALFGIDAYKSYVRADCIKNAKTVEVALVCEVRR